MDVERWASRRVGGRALLTEQLPYFLDRKMLREQLGLARVTIDRMREDVPEIKDARKVYWKRDEVLRWMDERMAA